MLKISIKVLKKLNLHHKIYGTTDYNEPPSVSISGVKSGLANTTVENTMQRQSHKKHGKLSDFIVATDPDTDTANKTIGILFRSLRFR